MTKAAREHDEDDVWQLAIACDDLWEGEMVGLRLDDTDVLLVKFGEHEVHAYADRCPHAGARLSEGTLCGTTLRCAVHHWEFDARSGEGVNPRKCALTRYPVQIAGGTVMVRLRARKPR